MALKKLFHMINPVFYADEALPEDLKKRLSKVPIGPYSDEEMGQIEQSGVEDLLSYVMQPAEGKVHCFMAFTIGGEEGYFLTAIMVFKMVGENAVEGWSIVNNRDGKGEFEANYVTPENGKVFDIIFDGALYMAGTEVTNDFMNQDLPPEKLQEMIAPSMKFLQSFM